MVNISDSDRYIHHQYDKMDSSRNRYNSVSIKELKSLEMLKLAQPVNSLAPKSAITATNQSLGQAAIRPTEV